jgi:Domain of unknown function (DUF4391)
MLVVSHGESISLSLAHKRPSLNEAAATIVDGAVITSPPLARSTEVEPDETTEGFFESLPLSCQPRVHLCAIYQDWIDRVEALLAARTTGRFALAANSQAAAERRAALLEF